MKNNAEKPTSEYKKAQDELVSFLDKDIFFNYLRNPNSISAYEIFCFEGKKISIMKAFINGSMKGAIHRAATNPHAYLNVS